MLSFRLSLHLSAMSLYVDAELHTNYDHYNQDTPIHSFDWRKDMTEKFLFDFNFNQTFDFDQRMAQKDFKSFCIIRCKEANAGIENRKKCKYRWMVKTFFPSLFRSERPSGVRKLVSQNSSGLLTGILNGRSIFCIHG